jgi:soluble cytochrome b562
MVTSMRLTRRQSCTLILSLSLLLPLYGFAQPGGDSPVHGEMEGINRAARQLGRQISDPAQKASSLELVATMQKHAEKAKTLTPPKAEKLTGDEKTKYVTTFQTDIDALLKQIAAVKDDLTNDKLDVAQADFRKIQDLKNSSHKELGVEGGPGGRKRGGPPPAPGQ